MNNRSQHPAEPDMALLYLGSVFEALHHAPERDDAKLEQIPVEFTYNLRA